MIGKLLGNRYEILEQLGGGGMAIVYKAKDNFLNRLVTIKILRPEYVTDSDFIRRFRREAQAVASLSHPNIVNIHDVGQENETQYLVMEYVAGDNLKNYLKNHPDLPLDKIVNIARQICDALQHAHENHIVHRDVKPQNILITNNERVKLTDFGIALEATTGTITNTETIVGSVHYISPEQAKGEMAGPQSDIYSLGVVLYEMLTRELPFKGDGPVAVALKHVQEQPKPPSEINPGIPEALERVVMKAMSKDVVYRYQTAVQFSQDLHNAVKGTLLIDDGDDFATRVLPAPISKDLISEEEEVEDKSQQRLNKKKIAVITVLLFLSLLSGVLFASYKYLNVPEVEVPEVIGMTVDDAREELNKVGLKSVVSEEYNDETEKGIVISQSIDPGRKAKQGREITLIVSLGPEMADLPDVRGKTQDEAELNLSNAGFDDITIVEAFDDEIEKGMVIDQSPAPGRQPKSTAVELKISKGKEPVKLEMPRFIGWKLNQAEEKINSLNLVLEKPVNYNPSDQYLEGQVISQTPSAGEEIEEGSTVSLTVSEGPGPKPRTAGIKVDIDNDKQKHEVRITITDILGDDRVVYVATHNSKEKVYQEVTFYGQAVIKVYVDGELVQEWTP